MRLRALRIQGVRITCYLHGQGPKQLVLLHGFPDDAASWLPLMESLPPDEYTVIAPYLRGYGPSGRAPDRCYSLRALGRDVIGLLDALSIPQAIVVGHDWGALAAYAAAQLDPTRLQHLVALSVPPPSVFLRNLRRDPVQLKRSLYMLGLQLPALGPAALRHDRFALIEHLWRAWSPGWDFPPERLAKVKTTFGYRHTPHAALRYYRALLLDAALDTPEWRRSLQLAMRPITCPTLVITGQDDRCIGPAMFERLERALHGPWRLERLPGCGHFPQHEAPDTVRDLITALWAH